MSAPGSVTSYSPEMLHRPFKIPGCIHSEAFEIPFDDIHPYAGFHPCELLQSLGAGEDRCTATRTCDECLRSEAVYPNMFKHVISTPGYGISGEVESPAFSGCDDLHTVMGPGRGCIGSTGKGSDGHPFVPVREKSVYPSWTDERFITLDVDHPLPWPAQEFPCLEHTFGAAFAVPCHDRREAMTAHLTRYSLIIRRHGDKQEAGPFEAVQYANYKRHPCDICKGFARQPAGTPACRYDRDGYVCGDRTRGLPGQSPSHLSVAQSETIRTVSSISASSSFFQYW